MGMSFGKRAAFGALLAFLILGTTTALAGNGVGGVFNLGQANTVNAETRLSGSTNTPQLTVQNANAGTAAGGLKVTNNGTSSAIASTNTGGGFGLSGLSSNGIGVFGRHTGASGPRPGVEGQTSSKTANASGVRGTVTAAGPGSLAAGVQGRISDATAFNGVGVLGEHAGNGYGGYFQASGGSSYGLYSQGGVFGGYLFASGPGSTGAYSSGIARGLDGYSEETDATSATAYGVFGDADAINGGHGVYGRADGSTGVNYGARAEVTSAAGFGGFFQNLATGTSGTGVQGFASGTTASGVVSSFFGGGGEFTGANGVIGVSDRSLGYGVLGIQGPGSYAGYFSGNVHVNGTLSKSAGSFKIDHPLDPENKTLSHSFVESPDMKNIYDGQVTLGDGGTATVRLPGYFEALNRDVRYQLTAIGAAAPDLHVSREVEGNAFSIAGGEPGLKVSWQVTGIRHDAYAEANRIPVEEDKPRRERGSYLNPGAFGKPRNRSVAGQGAGNARPAPIPVPAGDRRPRKRR